MYRFWMTAVLCGMFGLAVHSMMLKAPTVDEQGFLVRGLGYIRAENRWMRVGHPAGLGILNAALLWHDESVKLPIDDPSWLQTSFHRPAELFLWEIGNDVKKVIFLGRLPSVWLGMVLASVVARFARDITKRSLSGIIALIVVSLDPNIMAHSRLATTDLGLVAGAMIATYTLWSALHERQNRQINDGWKIVFAGIGFALLQNTKFTAGLFVPIFAMIIIVGVIERWRRNRQFPYKLILLLLTVYPLAAFIGLWGMYGFDIGMLPSSLPTLSSILGGRTFPLSHHIEQLSDLGGRMQKGTPAFLMGNYADTGWWYYFPIVLALKTPLPTLILTIGATIYFSITGYRFRWLTIVTIIMPPITFVLFGMTNGINIGYRHVLMVVPFMAVLIGVMAVKRSIPVVVLLLGWLLMETIFIAPDFLAYFNQLGGGASKGWHHLVDSNIDWGQDLRRLKLWMETHDVDQLRLSYFGEARPDYYDINYVGLPSFPPRLMSPNAITHYPDDPATGIYAISVTNLQGVLFDDHDLFAFFRDKKPIGQIGHSILIYDVEPYGVPADIALGSMPITALTADQIDQIGTNDRRLRWFDADHALLIPKGDHAFLAREGKLEVATNERKSFDSLPQITQFSHDDGIIALRDVTIQDEHIETVWEQIGEPADIKIFVHIVDDDGQIVAQWDHLPAVWHSWYSGDGLQITHQFQDMPAGHYDISIGVYDIATTVRWQANKTTDHYDAGKMIVE